MATAKSDFAERFVSGKYANGDHSAGRVFKNTGEALFAIGELRVRIREQGLDLKSAIDLVVGCTQEITRSSGVVVGLLQQDRVVYPARGGIAATMAGLHFHATLFQSCLKRGEAVHLPDAQKHPLVGATCGRDGIGSLIIVPIFHHREVAGGMEVLFKEKRSISAEDLVDLELFAGVISEGLNGAARIVLTRPEQPEYPPEIQALTNIGPHLEPSLREKTGLGDAPPRPSQDTTDAETLLVKSAAADDGACLTHL